MYRFRRILLSGLVALLMMGMVAANTEDGVATQAGDSVDRSYLGSMVNGICNDTNAWACLHLEFTFAWDIPISLF